MTGAAAAFFADDRVCVSDSVVVSRCARSGSVYACVTARVCLCVCVFECERVRFFGIFFLFLFFHSSVSVFYLLACSDGANQSRGVVVVYTCRYIPVAT